MAKPPGGSSCSVFVGNVPYDANEDELRDLFGKVGQVTMVRVVVDKDTKQPKGYAFCDFVDSKSVQLAITQLNNVEYNGRRLRIDWAERELNQSQSGGGGGERGAERPGGGRSGPPGGGPPSGGPGGGSEPPPLAVPVVTVADRMARLREQEATEQARQIAQDDAERAEIGRLMETLSPLQLFNIIGEMQRLAIRAPEVARALAGENLQLALALQHAQFLIGMTEEPPLPSKPEVQETARNVRQRIWVPDEELARPAQAAHVGPTVMLGQIQPGIRPMPPAPRAAMGQTAGQNPQDKGFLESLVSLSPAEIDRLEHGTKVRLLEYLQSLHG